MIGIYKLADVVVEIDSLYDEVHKMLRGYEETTGEAASIHVCTREKDIEAEADQLESFPLPYLETLAVYRQISSQMVAHKVLLMHGSVVAVDGKAYMFTAASGTGKSTHTRLWRQLFGERAVMINDDKPLVRVHEKGYPEVYGTPWDGKHRLSTNTSAPLCAICILERGKENYIEPVSIQDAYPMLLQQTYRPSQPMDLLQVMELLERICNGLKIYRLKCNMDISAAEVAYEGMK